MLGGTGLRVATSTAVSGPREFVCDGLSCVREDAVGRGVSDGVCGITWRLQGIGLPR
jgi:hypothetical protein